MDDSGSAPIYPNVRTPEDVFRDFRGRRAGILKALTTGTPSLLLTGSFSHSRFGTRFVAHSFVSLGCFRGAQMWRGSTSCATQKENLCLYGLSNETWEVTLPAEEVPPELPEPALGINFARDGMAEKDWLTLVAVHSDAWLIAVAFYFGARFGFDKDARELQNVYVACYNAYQDIIACEENLFSELVHGCVRQKFLVIGNLMLAIKHHLDLNCRRRLFTMISNLPTVYDIVTGNGKKQSKPPNSNGKSKSGSKVRMPA
ncbi:hypothetical protein HU200_032019 [Digitaria exilis]|uniref:PHD finger protein ALFIN-LIKE n=1 Tax=Digitaria exilis TaxID=1010633 RepID=A0A835EPD7_9POAL|nr:hypothetical protein HU200_032019 [Digitaria exilis]